MRPRFFIVCAAVLSILLVHGSALAGGWGPYFSWGREEPSTGLPSDFIDLARGFLPDSVIRELEAADFDVSMNHLTFGVMYESAPAQDKLLSYRGTLGFDIAANTTVEDITVAGFSVKDFLGFTGFDLEQNSKYGLSTNHTLAFGIIRTSRLKWWAGPGIGLTFNYYDIGTALDLKAANLSIGGGGETGVNIHLGSSMTLCLGGGIHWRAFAYGGGGSDVGSLVWGNGPLYFIQTSLLFRTGRDRG
jgi:hypothetical protein